MIIITVNEQTRTRFTTFFSDVFLSSRESSFRIIFVLNSLYADGLFHCYRYMLDESVGRFRGIRSILWLLYYF